MRKNFETDVIGFALSQSRILFCQSTFILEFPKILNDVCTPIALIGKIYSEIAIHLTFS